MLCVYVCADDVDTPTTTLIRYNMHNGLSALLARSLLYLSSRCWDLSKQLKNLQEFTQDERVIRVICTTSFVKWMWRSH